MASRKLKLGCPEVAAVIDKRHAAEKVGWKKERLLVIKLAARGAHSGEDIGQLCGISRAQVYALVKLAREQGLERVLQRGKRGRPEGWRKDIDEAVTEEFERKLKAHEFNTLEVARRWLRDEHGIEASYNRIWYWAKKLGGVLRVARPRHSKQDSAATDAFREQLGEKLDALGLEPGTRAKIWVMDEARFGLHTMLRRVWSVRGSRPVVECQIKYEWDYLYGSLEVVEGEAHFCQIPGVNLQWDRRYLEDLAASDPQAVHVLIRDQAGFHLRDNDERLPANVRIIDLPPYSPELNPCEQLWDMIKDELGNRVFETIEELREATMPILIRWWQDAGSVLQLIGRPWLRDQANASWRS